MKHSKFFSNLICVVCLAFIGITIYGCGNKEPNLWGVDHKNAESIYECTITPDTEGFEFIKDEDKDGSYCIRIEHHSFPKSDHYRLYSPNGNLRIIASGAQEQGGLDGYRIDYDANGKICNVVNLGSLDDEEYLKIDSEESSVAIMKRWLRESLMEEPEGQGSTFISRDEDGYITSMRDIDIPYGCRARLFIKEWGPFWDSDLSGGHMGFFVMVENVEYTDGSYVDYLYCDGKLIAELAYWKGVFIKARTYNNRGVMVDMYTDRSLDIIEQAYEDNYAEPKWYVDK